MTFNNSEYQAKYKKERYDRLTFEMKKGTKEVLKNYVKEKGYKSTNEYLRELVKRDSGIEL